MQKLILALIAGFGPILAQAQSVPYEHSGNYWLPLCKAESKDRVQCLRFIDGIVKGAAGQASLSNTPEVLCVPEGVTSGQAVEIVGKFMAEKPQHLHHDMTVIVFRSLADAFPCQRK